MSTRAEDGQSSQLMYAIKGKKKGKGRQEHKNYEESEDGIERWNRRNRIARLHELLPPCSTSDAYELVKLVGDFYHAEAFEMQKRSRSTTSNISQDANDFFMDGMSNVSSLIEWACGDLQLPDIDNLLEGDECWHCGRKDDEGGGRKRGEGAAAQAILDADPYPLPSELDLVDPEAPGVIEAVIAQVMAEDEDLQQQQEGRVDEGKDVEDAIEEGEEDEAMGGEDTSQAARSCSEKEEAGNEMGAVEDMDGAEDSGQAMALDEMDAREDKTLMGEPQRLTRELDTLREEFGKANELNKDLQTKLDVTQEELDKRDKNFDEPRDNMVIALKQISTIKGTVQYLNEIAEALPISHSPVRRMPPLPKLPGSSRVMRLGRPPLNAHEELKAQTSRFRNGLNTLLSETKSSETVLRRQYLIILKRYCDKSQAKRDQRSLSRTDMVVETEPGEPLIDVGCRMRDTVDLQLEIAYLENACFMHDNRSEEWKSDTDRLDEFARFRARHVEFTGISEPGHALIPVIPSREDWYVGVTVWLRCDQAQTPLPTTDMLDKLCHWQWPEVKLAVYSWAFYDLLDERYWKTYWDDQSSRERHRSAVWEVYLHARDGLSPELREKYSTARLWREDDVTISGVHGPTP